MHRSGRSAIQAGSPRRQSRLKASVFGSIMILWPAAARPETVPRPLEEETVSMRVLPLPLPVHAARARHVHGVLVVRRHGHWYHGYGAFETDREAYPWLAFTAISLKSLDRLTEAQQRAHEAAQVAATDAPVGEAVPWRLDGAAGSVTTLGEGTSTSGRTCREFRQEITVDGSRERAYGTACVQDDGAWEVVATSPDPTGDAGR